tara:strand:+ start:11933 stop:12781 length:849 start_codon:yes stop_codon:yes gene_type:complete
MKAKKTNKKETPKAFAGLAVAAGLSAVPSIIAGYQGYKAQKEAAKEASDLKAMMPSLTTQEDYYNFYQKQAQALNEGKMQNQLDQAISAGAKTMEGAGTRGVLGGVQGVVSQAAQTKFDLEQQGQDKLLGAYEKMIQAKNVDRQRLTTLQQTAENQQAAGLQTMLSGMQGAADIGASAITSYGASKSTGNGLSAEQTKALRDAGLMKEGGSIEKTPGEFSHAKNPIDIVRDGSKIAEMTGGEYIFNPTQMKDIKGMVSKGSKEELHSYMKTLIKRFEKKAVK